MNTRLHVLLMAASTGILLAGCAERPVQLPREAQPVPMYRYEPPPAYAAAPAALPGPAPAPTQGVVAAAPSQTAPVAGQIETFPTSPGPNYVWMPSYWATSVRGDWVWTSGHYINREGLSDEQLRAARGMLEQARGSLKGKSLKRINNAIEEINDALEDQ